MIAIVDYEAGNLTSVARAVAHIGYRCAVTQNADEIQNADRIIFPGVGAAGAAMKSLRRLGLHHVLARSFAKGKPILGICLGTQIIMGFSEENQTPCLGLIPGSVRAFKNICDSNGSRLKIPHMGWNSIQVRSAHPVLADLRDADEFYFVHGYYPDPVESRHALALTEYGLNFASVIGDRNLIATQFHPEKSGRPGLKILENFCRWEPC
jgi:glutamine amidotransferase